MGKRYTIPVADANQSWTAVSDLFCLMRTTALFPTTAVPHLLSRWSVLQKCAWASAGYTMMVKPNKVEITWLPGISVLGLGRCVFAYDDSHNARMM